MYAVRGNDDEVKRVSEAAGKSLSRDYGDEFEDIDDLIDRYLNAHTESTGGSNSIGGGEGVCPSKQRRKTRDVLSTTRVIKRVSSKEIILTTPVAAAAAANYYAPPSSQTNSLLFSRSYKQSRRNCHYILPQSNTNFDEDSVISEPIHQGNSASYLRRVSFIRSGQRKLSYSGQTKVQRSSSVENKYDHQHHHHHILGDSFVTPTAVKQQTQRQFEDQLLLGHCYTASNEAGGGGGCTTPSRVNQPSYAMPTIVSAKKTSGVIRRFSHIRPVTAVISMDVPDSDDYPHATTTTATTTEDVEERKFQLSLNARHWKKAVVVSQLVKPSTPLAPFTITPLIQERSKSIGKENSRPSRGGEESSRHGQHCFTKVLKSPAAYDGSNTRYSRASSTFALSEKIQSDTNQYRQTAGRVLCQKNEEEYNKQLRENIHSHEKRKRSVMKIAETSLEGVAAVTKKDNRQLMQRQTLGCITKAASEDNKERGFKSRGVAATGTTSNFYKEPTVAAVKKEDASLPLKNECKAMERYEMQEVIGKGSYAIVKLAKDLLQDSLVAIKMYDKLKLADPQKRSNVKREISILNKLKHVNVIKLYSTIDTKNSLNLVMEYVSKVSLRQYMKNLDGRYLEERTARGMFIQLIRGVAYCHEWDVVHRDIKLENIMVVAPRESEGGGSQMTVVGGGDTVKLIDFGFAIRALPTQKLNIFCGTPTYMAPEITKKVEYLGKPADVWSCGVVLFALLCGRFPFKGKDDQELFKKIQNGEYRVSTKTSQLGANLIHKLLRQNPAERPQAKEILQDPWMTI